MMSLHDKLDLIWNKAAQKYPCSCNNDDGWGQEITGEIFCENCGEQVVE